MRGRRLLVETALLLLTAVVLAVAMRGTLAEAFRIPSGSMEPQLDIGDRVVVSRLAYRLHDPRRGDVVVFDCPESAGCAPAPHAALPVRAVQTVLEAVLLREPQPEEYIKRVIGLPGETVQGKDGWVWVNGRKLIEPYLAPGVVTSNFGPETIGPGRLWMMGDNRDHSSDSRMFGQVDARTVVGRAVVRIWPPWRTAFL
ncbi:MAG: signal peptidase [Acidimicrobiales bacterium]|jgi:signal peptidase I|nr:signal peptidase [Acidimicrobiales bacterium]